jgi:hypothetical protein
MLGLLKAILKPKEPAKHNLSASTSAIINCIQRDHNIMHAGVA